MIVFQRKRPLAVLTVGLSVLLALAVLVWTPARADTEGATAYRVGDQYTVPDGTVTAGDKEYPASTVVYFPDGTATTLKTVTLSQMGLYTVEYRAEVNGRLIQRYETLYAGRALYALTGDGGSAAYAPSPHAPAVNGIQLKLAAGNRFAFHKVIDLKSLDGPFFSSFFSPQKTGEMDALTFYVRLSDVRDENVYVTVKVNASRDGIGHGVSYLAAGASGQPLTGVEWNLNRIHRNNIYGFPVNASFYGVSKVGHAVSDNGIDLWYDTETNEVKTKTNAFGQNVIVDLDDPAYFTDPFAGFSTGEVLLSVWADDLQKSSFGLQVKSIGAADLSAQELTDTDPPVITADLDGYAEPPAALAGNPYPLFAASAYDSYSENLSVTGRVFRNYADPHRTELNVTGGAFVPDKPGVYTIEYSASDWSGNAGKTTVEVTAQAQAPAVTLTVDDTDRITSGAVGERIALSQAAAGGGIGRVTLTVEAALGGKVYPTDGKTFTPDAPGTYTITYTAADYVGQTATDSYTLTIATGTKPVFTADPALPKYFLTDTLYTLPDAEVYDFTGGGKQRVDATVTVKDDRGERALGADRQTYFNVTGASTTVIVTYSASIASGTASRSYPVKAVNRTDENGDLRLSNFFDAEGFDSVGLNDEGTTFAGIGRFTFVNQLMADDFGFVFTVDTAKRGLTGVNLVLTDAVSGQQVKIEIRKKNAYSEFSVNGGTKYSLGMSFTDPVKSRFELSFDNANARVSLENAAYVPIAADTEGRPFAGFTSGRVYLTGETIGGADSAVTVVSINSQPVNTVPIDRVAPKISLTGAYGGSKKPGELVTLNKVLAMDVIDPFPTLTLSVYGADGQPLTSESGQPLDNVPAVGGETFRTGGYGVYRVEYTAVDASGKRRSFSYNVWVDDDQPPVIEPLAKIRESCAVGDVVVVPAVRATDNVSEDKNITISRVLFLPGGRTAALPGNSFKATYEGTYVVRITARDEAGNLAVLDMTVTATEGGSEQ